MDLKHALAAMAVADLTERSTGVRCSDADAIRVSHGAGADLALDASATGLLYRTIQTQLYGTDVSLTLVRDIIESDPVLMDTYSEMVWNKAKLVSEKEALRHTVMEDADQASWEINELLTEGVDGADSEVIDVIELPPEGPLADVADPIADADVVLVNNQLSAAVAQATRAHGQLSPQCRVFLSQAAPDVSVTAALRALQLTAHPDKAGTFGEFARERDFVGMSLENAATYSRLQDMLTALEAADDVYGKQLGIDCLNGLISAYRRLLTLRHKAFTTANAGRSPMMTAIYADGDRSRVYVFGNAPSQSAIQALRNYGDMERSGPRAYDVGEVDALGVRAAELHMAALENDQSARKAAIGGIVRRYLLKHGDRLLKAVPEDKREETATAVGLSMGATMRGNADLQKTLRMAMYARCGEHGMGSYTVGMVHALESAMVGNASADETHLSAVAAEHLPVQTAQLISSYIMPTF